MAVCTTAGCKEVDGFIVPARPVTPEDWAEMDRKVAALAKWSNAKRLLEIADELEEMARGYLEKGAQLHHEAARNRAAAAELLK